MSDQRAEQRAAKHGAMRNEALTGLDVLVGDWKLTMTDAWFLESRETKVRGSARIDWLGDAFLVMRSDLGGDPAWDLVIGRSDATSGSWSCTTTIAVSAASSR